MNFHQNSKEILTACISSLKMIFFSRTIPIGITVAVVPKLREMELAVIANLLPAIVVAVVMAFLPFSF